MHTHGAALAIWKRVSTQEPNITTPFFPDLTVPRLSQSSSSLPCRSSSTKYHVHSTYVERRQDRSGE